CPSHQAARRGPALEALSDQVRRYGPCGHLDRYGQHSWGLCWHAPHHYRAESVGAVGYSNSKNSEGHPWKRVGDNLKALVHHRTIPGVGPGPSTGLAGAIAVRYKIFDTGEISNVRVYRIVDRAIISQCPPTA